MPELVERLVIAGVPAPVSYAALIAHALHQRKEGTTILPLAVQLPSGLEYFPLGSVLTRLTEDLRLDVKLAQDYAEYLYLASASEGDSAKVILLFGGEVVIRRYLEVFLRERFFLHAPTVLFVADGDINVLLERYPEALRDEFSAMFGNVLQLPTPSA